MKQLFYLFLLVSCGPAPSGSENPSIIRSAQDSKESISEVMDQWHEAAAATDFDAYFSMMAEEAIFIGTDATENWEKSEFREWAKPYFDRGQAWNFSSLERNIFLSEAGELAWFDELLDTQMGICRGSGVLIKTGGEWKIKHYVLSIAIPNEVVPKVTELKEEIDSSLISGFRGR